MRCLVPAEAFCEYQDGPSPKAKRWFARADGKPFFFAGTRMSWENARGTKKKPIIGTHEPGLDVTVRRRDGAPIVC
jgi:putative SOS response-associated peptidase YedK